MAVSNLVRDFWPRFRRPIIATIIIGQGILLALTVGALWYFEIITSNPAAAAVIFGVQAVIGGLFLSLIYRLLSKPTKHLVNAIQYMSGEPTATPPPIANEKHFEKNGFKVVLQTLYSLTSAKPDAETTQPANSIIEQALDDTVCGFLTMDSQRKITYANKATPIRVNTDGVSSLDIIFNDNDTFDAWLDECNKNSVRAEKTWSRVSNKLPNEEGRRYFDVIASYNKGAANEVVMVLIDRTHLYSIGEEELDFIAFAAHELRGPITVIRGYLDVLSDELSDVLAEDQKELFRRLSVSANRLSGYVNNILNTSRYDRRHLRIHLAETTASAIYNTIRDDMALRASSQNRLLSVSIPEDLPTIAADATSLSEVIGNIIDNAIKYSNEGGAIQVSAALRGDMVDISIEDHGIGMPGNVISNLFQKFYRSHRSRETVAGTGIGLYISKAIVESHGGTISVRSEEGKGSTFTISIPTYRSVADKLQTGDNESVMKKSESGVYIKNHASYRG